MMLTNNCMLCLTSHVPSQQIVDNVQNIIFIIFRGHSQYCTIFVTSCGHCTEDITLLWYKPCLYFNIFCTLSQFIYSNNLLQHALYSIAVDLHHLFKQSKTLNRDLFNNLCNIPPFSQIHVFIVRSVYY